ncbi:MAG: hypothetical protein IPJ88_04180 [Myxococcales bacterium]|nr:MAG: hypothetical protein IPJ88_04180 [Myxococcales bacterium]
MRLSKGFNCLKNYRENRFRMNFRGAVFKLLFLLRFKGGILDRGCVGVGVGAALEEGTVLASPERGAGLACALVIGVAGRAKFSAWGEGEAFRRLGGR